MAYYLAISQAGWGKGSSPTEAASNMIRATRGHVLRPLGFFVVRVLTDEAIGWAWDHNGFHATDPADAPWEYAYEGRIEWSGDDGIPVIERQLEPR